MTPLLQAQGLDVAIGARTLCRGLDLTLQGGECWAILGGNGVGKTTLLHTLAGLRAPAAGSVLLEEQTLDRLPRRRVARRLGLLPQDSVDPFPASVLETALIGRHPHLGRWQQEGPDDLARARAALEAMSLSDLAARRTDTLSGGERRRLAVATLLTQDPQLLLLDEPTNHLDLHQQIVLLERLRGLAGAGRGVLMVLHDVNLAARFCDHLLLLFGDGSWQAGAADPLLDAALLSRLYGHPVAAVAGPAGTRAFLPG